MRLAAKTLDMIRQITIFSIFYFLVRFDFANENKYLVIASVITLFIGFKFKIRRERPTITISKLRHAIQYHILILLSVDPK